MDAAASPAFAPPALTRLSGRIAHQLRANDFDRDRPIRRDRAPGTDPVPRPINRSMWYLPPATRRRRRGPHRRSVRGATRTSTSIPAAPRASIIAVTARDDIDRRLWRFEKICRRKCRALSRMPMRAGIVACRAVAREAPASDGGRAGETAANRSAAASWLCAGFRFRRKLFSAGSRPRAPAALSVRPLR